MADNGERIDYGGKLACPSNLALELLTYRTIKHLRMLQGARQVMQPRASLPNRLRNSMRNNEGRTRPEGKYDAALNLYVNVSDGVETLVWADSDRRALCSCSL